MNRFSLYALALAVCAGTTAAALANHNSARKNQSFDAHLALDGAYRDGLYLGRLTAESGQPLSPPIGRWSSERDRERFAAGYRHGYNDVLAHTTPIQNMNE